MTRDEKGFLEDMDMMLLSGSISESFYDERNTLKISSFPSLPSVPDIWTETLNAVERGSQEDIVKALAKVEKSELLPSEKQWLTVLLLSAQTEPHINSLKKIASGSRRLPENEEQDCIAQLSSIIANKKITAHHNAIRAEYEEKTADERDKEAVLEQIVRESADALKDAEKNLSRHNSKRLR